jgi:hypothetical protein
MENLERANDWRILLRPRERERERERERFKITCNRDKGNKLE